MANQNVKEFLLSKGFTGKKLGEIFKQIKGMTFEEVQKFVETGEKPEHESHAMQKGSMWHWLCTAPFFDLIGSNSEKRRMLENGAVEINGTRPKPDDFVPMDLTSLVFFPSSPTKRITVW